VHPNAIKGTAGDKSRRGGCLASTIKSLGGVKKGYLKAVCKKAVFGESEGAQLEIGILGTWLRIWDREYPHTSIEKGSWPHREFGPLFERNEWKKERPYARIPWRSVSKLSCESSFIRIGRNTQKHTNRDRH